MTELKQIEPDFNDPRLAEAVERLSTENVHKLPYGAIRLDADGNATFYSDTERSLSGCPYEVLGRNFFVEIAPCLDNPHFRGRIDRAMAVGTLNIRFSYTAKLFSGTTNLDVRIQSATGGGCWIFNRFLLRQR